MIKITKVLVATDFSDASESALLYGREFARTFGAALHVLHVTENPVVWTGAESAGVDFVRVQADLEEGAQNALNRIVTAEDRAQLKAVTAVLSGNSPAFEIAGYAKREGIDIILMGTHGRGMVRASADGQRGREGRADCAVPGADGSVTRNTSSSFRMRWRPSAR